MQLVPHLDINGFDPPTLATVEDESTLKESNVRHIPGTFLYGGPRGEPQVMKLDFYLPPTQIGQIGESRMWLVGYVEYSTFGRRYRAGYCRRINPKVTDDRKGNLSFEHTTAQCNYDRELDDRGNHETVGVTPRLALQKW